MVVTSRAEFRVKTGGGDALASSSSPLAIGGTSAVPLCATHQECFRTLRTIPEKGAIALETLLGEIVIFFQMQNWVLMFYGHLGLLE